MSKAIIISVLLGLLVAILIFTFAMNRTNDDTFIFPKNTCEQEVFDIGKEPQTEQTRLPVVTMDMEEPKEYVEKCRLVPVTENAKKLSSVVDFSKPSRFSILEAWLKPEAARFGPPPVAIPAVLRNAYTLGGKIPVQELYFENEAYLGGEARMNEWKVDTIERLQAETRQRKAVFNYDNAPLYRALDTHRDTIAGKRGIVIGSETPWAEAMLLEYGATNITTLEFGSIRSEHPRIQTYTPPEFTPLFLRNKIPPYDFAFSYSSLEHDGLGRYGDSLNPDGDLLYMRRMMHLVKPGGFAFIGMPCCLDILVWNAHRSYGPLRMPLLVAGWHLVGMYWSPKFDESGGWDVAVDQPVWVLQNKFGCRTIEG